MVPDVGLRKNQVFVFVQHSHLGVGKDNWPKKKNLPQVKKSSGSRSKSSFRNGTHLIVTEDGVKTVLLLNDNPEETLSAGTLHCYVSLLRDLHFL